MNFKTLLLTCALSTAAFSFTAMSSETSICNDPIATVCTNTIEMRAQRDRYTNDLKVQISNEANKNAAPRIEEMKKKISKFHFIKRAIQTYKIRNQEIMKSAKSRLGGIETVITNPENIAKLKGLMNQAIDESNFNAATKANFKSVQSTVIIGNFSDFIERTNLDDDITAQLLMNACGSDGLVANAFATTLSGQRYVLICPGFLISASQDASNEERFNTILQAIAHEMGHHIDNSKVGNAVYAPYLGCLENNYADQFNKTSEDTKFCEKNKNDPKLCKAKVVESHGGELIADQWGLKVSAIHARKSNYSYAQTDALLVSSWNRLCSPTDPKLKGKDDEGIHPTGDFRIGTLMRVNPDISGVLSCNNSMITKPACTLDGAVSLNF